MNLGNDKRKKTEKEEKDRDTAGLPTMVGTAHPCIILEKYILPYHQLWIETPIAHPCIILKGYERRPQNNRPSGVIDLLIQPDTIYQFSTGERLIPVTRTGIKISWFITVPSPCKPAAFDGAPGPQNLSKLMSRERENDLPVWRRWCTLDETI